MPQNPIPHVLIFPFPAQGHVNSMLKLAELLCLSSDLHVTFLNATHYHSRLIRFTDAQTRFASFPLFRFETIPDGISNDNSPSAASLTDMFKGLNTVMLPAFRKLIASDYLKSVGRPQVTCIIIDGLMSDPIQFAKELGIATISFRTTSACYIWAIFHYRSLLEAGELPYQAAEMDTLVKSIPGMEIFLRCRDLPSFFRINDDPVQQFAVKATINSTGASATLLNTFDDLEAPIISFMRHHFPKIYTIGPLHALLTTRRSISSSNSNSLWEVDRSCMAWLDCQPVKSVMYVSFGSVVLMSHNEMLELWYGFVNSGKRFLWVLRPDSVTDKEEKYEIPVELTEGTKERGYIVEWSPQEEVLVHPAVGGFLTHSGWNSTLESIIAGVPMMCWPQMADQQINSRFVSEVWKIGLDMKDTCDRSKIEKMINDLMEDKREEIIETMSKISAMGKESVGEGGTSYSNLESLIGDIKFMRLEV